METPSQSENSNPSVATPPPAVEVLLSQRHALWLLALMEVALLLLIISHVPHTLAHRKEIESRLTERANKVAKVEQEQRAIEGLVADLVRIAQKDPQAAALVAKYRLR